MVTTMSSSAIRSSIVNSPSSLVISVRRSSPNFSAIFGSSSLMSAMRFGFDSSSARRSLIVRAHFLELLLELLDLEAGELARGAC